MENIAGKKYGKLIAIEIVEWRTGPTKNPNYTKTTRIWNCRCECGNIEPFAQSDLTGRKAKRCSKCLEKELSVVTARRLAQNKLQIERPNKSEGVDRSKPETFVKYWEDCPLHFKDTFGVPYSPEVALEQFNKIMNPQKNQQLTA